MNPLAVMMGFMNVGAALIEVRDGAFRLAGIYCCYAVASFLMAGIRR